MREMKDSGVEWIGKIPLHWGIVKMARICDVITDFVASGSFASLAKNVTYLDSPDYAMLVRAVDVSGKGHTMKQVYISQHAYNFLSNSNLFGGELMFPNIGAVGDVYIVPKLYDRMTLAPNSIMVRSKESHKYLYYYFYSNAGRLQLVDIAQSTAQPKFNKTDFRQLKIVLPNRYEQIQIVAYLDEKCTQIDTLIQNVQTQIEKLKAYKQSLITEAVTKGLDSTVPMKDSGVDWIGAVPRAWRVAALKYFIDILPGYAFSSNDFDTEGGIPLLRGINVTPNGIRWDDTVYWNKDFPYYLKPYLLQDKDIVVGLDRPWISEGTRITRITERDLPALLLQRVCRIRVRHCIDSRWVYLWIASNAFKESLSTETTGISVPHISTKQIGEFIVALPSMEEQKEICDHIDAKCNQIDRLIAIKQSKIEKLEQYKKSLIYEYVTGKKEVRL